MHRNPLYNKTNFTAELVNDFLTFSGKLVDDIKFTIITTADEDYSARPYGRCTIRTKTEVFSKSVSVYRIARDLFKLEVILDYFAEAELGDVKVEVEVFDCKIKSYESIYDSYYSSLRKIRTLSKGFHVGLFAETDKQPFRLLIEHYIDVEKPVILKLADSKFLESAKRKFWEQRENFTTLQLEDNIFLVRGVYDEDHPSYVMSMAELALPACEISYKLLDVYDFARWYPKHGAELYAEDVDSTLAFLNTSIVTYRSPIYQEGSYLKGENLGSEWMVNSYVLADIEAYATGMKIRAIVNSMRANASKGDLIATSPIDIMEKI